MGRSSVAIVVRRDGPTSPEGRVILDELSAMLAVSRETEGNRGFSSPTSNGAFYIARTALREPL
jgi:hypothetical protein